MIIGHSPCIRNIIKLAEDIAKTDYSVLLRGETGTGKELFARLIHDNSRRRAKEYRVANISAFNENLINSELFGHEKGAFTGASHQRKGLIELTGEGTLFLDEIGDLDPQSQRLLLRVLQNRVFNRVGGNENLPVKARIIAATNAPLEDYIEERRFREDLLHRFEQLIVLPPLRDRKLDIPELVLYILGVETTNPNHIIPEWYSEKHAKGIAEMLSRLDYPWPGNIRELSNVVKTIVVSCISSLSEFDFMERITKYITDYCRERYKTGHKVNGVISNLVENYLSSYREGEASLRSYLNDILVDGVSEGLDLAIARGEFKPGSCKELGKALGIPALENRNRSTLPKGTDDYIVQALKTLGVRQELPSKINEVIGQSN